MHVISITIDSTSFGNFFHLFHLRFLSLLIASQMNKTNSHPVDFQIGASGTVSKQHDEIGIDNGVNSINAGSGKESIVQKLQGVLFTVRRDRDREHRSLDITMEKLRSAREVFQTEKRNFKEEEEKLKQTQEDSEKTQQEILQKQAAIENLQQKVR